MVSQAPSVTVREADSVPQLRQALLAALETMPDDITNDGDARLLRLTAGELLLAGGKINAAVKAYFRGY